MRATLEHTKKGMTRIAQIFTNWGVKSPLSNSYYYGRESRNNNKILKNPRRDGPRLCPKDPAAARCIGSQPRSLLSPTPFPSAAAGASHSTAVRPCGFAALGKFMQFVSKIPTA